MSIGKMRGLLCVAYVKLDVIRPFQRQKIFLRHGSCFLFWSSNCRWHNDLLTVNASDSKYKIGYAPSQGCPHTLPTHARHSERSRGISGRLPRMNRLYFGDNLKWPSLHRACDQSIRSAIARRSRAAELKRERFAGKTSLRYCSSEKKFAIAGCACPHAEAPQTAGKIDSTACRAT